MVELDATRHRGWSYAVGWSQDFAAFLARAWKPREKPKRTRQGVLLFLHSLSATGGNLEEAAKRCALAVSDRERGVEHEDSDYERRYIAAVLRASAP